jgi:hypothetical protein
MRTWIIPLCKVNLPLSLFTLLALILPGRAHAQWPPFKFNLDPSYAEGQIVYDIRLSSKVDWTMADVTLKIPLPDGTRFLEASTLPTTQVNFDGAEVTFFTSLSKIKDAYFIVEVTDPAKTVFTTHAWISWQGDQPGDYLKEDVSIDITLQPLNWEKPRDPRLGLEVRAKAADRLITYLIYPEKNTTKRIWDVNIAIPVPEGTTFMSADAPPPFVTGFDGQVASFSVVELAEQSQVIPLSLTVSAEGVTAPLVLTHAWGVWRNVGGSVGLNVPAEEGTKTGDIIVQPDGVQWVVGDMLGDVPFSNYDLVSVAFQQERSALKIIFYTAGDVGPVGDPLEFVMYIDNDCRADTGKPESDRGVEYRMRYRHDRGTAVFQVRDEEGDKWSATQSSELNSLVRGNMVAAWVPYELLEDGRRFCWVAEAKNRTTAFDPRPRTERVPDSKDLRITQYEALLESTTIDTQPSTVGLSNSDVIIESEPVDSTPPTEPEIESEPVNTTPPTEPEREVTRGRKSTGGPSEW